MNLRYVLRSYIHHHGWRRCDNACGWTWPYGYVPECSCPVHDPERRWYIPWRIGVPLAILRSKIRRWVYDYPYANRVMLLLTGGEIAKGTIDYMDPPIEYYFWRKR